MVEAAPLQAGGVQVAAPPVIGGADSVGAAAWRVSRGQTLTLPHPAGIYGPVDSWIQSAGGALERARRAMATAKVDAVFVASPGLVAFLTGHVVPAYLAYPSRDGRLEKPALALVTAEDAVTVAVSPDPAVGLGMPYGEGGRGLADGVAAFSAVTEVAGGLGLTRGSIAVEAGLVPAAAVDALRAAAPGAQLIALDGLLRDARMPKSDAELTELRRAIALCDAGQDAVRAAVAPGVTEGELYAAAVRAMIAAAGELVISVGEIQVGVRGALMMGPPTSAAIAAGELAMSDLAPRHPNGWWGDSCLTVACGEPSAEQRATWRLLRDALEAGRERLRPGVTAREVYEAVARHAGPQPGHAGHGIGRDHFEEPRIAPDDDTPLPADAVIVLEPGAYDDRQGMRLEHAFRVTADGGEPLSAFSLELTA